MSTTASANSQQASIHWNGQSRLPGYLNVLKYLGHHGYAQWTMYHPPPASTSRS